MANRKVNLLKYCKIKAGFLREVSRFRMKRAFSPCLKVAGKCVVADPNPVRQPNPCRIDFLSSLASPREPSALGHGLNAASDRLSLFAFQDA